MDDTPGGSYLEYHVKPRWGGPLHYQYAFSAPPGYKIRSVTIELIGEVSKWDWNSKEEIEGYFGFYVRRYPLSYTPHNYFRVPLPPAPDAIEQEYYRDETKSVRRQSITFTEGLDAIELGIVLREAKLYGWSIEATLVPKPSPSGTGSIFISSDPKDAIIYVDGKERGRTPSLIENIPTGRHKVEVKKEVERSVIYPLEGQWSDSVWIKETYFTPPQKIHVEKGKQKAAFFQMKKGPSPLLNKLGVEPLEWKKVIAPLRSLHIDGINLMQDRDGKYWMVWSWSTGESCMRNNYNIWISSSEDGLSWQKPRKLAINSSGNNLEPVMTQGKDGKYWLAWVKDGTSIVIAHSLDTVAWSEPISVVKSSLHNRGPEAGCSPIYLLQWKDGGFLIGYRSAGIHIVTSLDGLVWSRPMRVKIGDGVGGSLLEFGLSKDYAGRYWITQHYRVASPECDQLLLILSEDGTKWHLLTQIPSLFPEPAPVLIGDNRGEYILFWNVSGFRVKDKIIIRKKHFFMGAQPYSISRNGKIWSEPQTLFSYEPPWSHIDCIIQDMNGTYWFVSTGYGKPGMGKIIGKYGDIWIGKLRNLKAHAPLKEKLKHE